MAEREKVIKGLECSIGIRGRKNCDDCPYDNDFNCIGCDIVLRDAIALLKEQEPRVLTLEEVKKLRSLYDGAVWLETCAGILFPVLPEMSLQDSTFYVAIPLVGYRSWGDNKYYGKTWRCWSARPTDEQREAVPWGD